MEALLENENLKPLEEEIISTSFCGLAIVISIYLEKENLVFIHIVFFQSLSYY